MAAETPKSKKVSSFSRLTSFFQSFSSGKSSKDGKKSSKIKPVIATTPIRTPRMLPSRFFSRVFSKPKAQSEGKPAKKPAKTSSYKVKESVSLTGAAVERSPQAMFLVDPWTADVTHASGSAPVALGLMEGELTGKSLLEFAKELTPAAWGELVGDLAGPAPRRVTLKLTGSCNVEATFDLHPFGTGVELELLASLSSTYNEASDIRLPGSSKPPTTAAAATPTATPAGQQEVPASAPAVAATSASQGQDKHGRQWSLSRRTDSQESLKEGASPASSSGNAASRASPLPKTRLSFGRKDAESSSPAGPPAPLDSSSSLLLAEGQGSSISGLPVENSADSRAGVPDSSSTSGSTGRNANGLAGLSDALQRQPRERGVAGGGSRGGTLPQFMTQSVPLTPAMLQAIRAAEEEEEDFEPPPRIYRTDSKAQQQHQTLLQELGALNEGVEGDEGGGGGGGGGGGRGIDGRACSSVQRSVSDFYLGSGQPVERTSTVKGRATPSRSPNPHLLSTAAALSASGVVLPANQVRRPLAGRTGRGYDRNYGLQKGADGYKGGRGMGTQSVPFTPAMLAAYQTADEEEEVTSGWTLQDEIAGVGASRGVSYGMEPGSRPAGIVGGMSSGASSSMGAQKQRGGEIEEVLSMSQDLGFLQSVMSAASAVAPESSSGSQGSVTAFSVAEVFARNTRLKDDQRKVRSVHHIPQGGSATDTAWSGEGGYQQQLMTQSVPFTSAMRAQEIAAMQGRDLGGRGEGERVSPEEEQWRLLSGSSPSVDMPPPIRRTNSKPRASAPMGSPNLPGDIINPAAAAAAAAAAATGGGSGVGGVGGGGINAAAVLNAAAAINAAAAAAAMPATYADLSHTPLSPSLAAVINHAPSPDNDSSSMLTYASPNHSSAGGYHAGPGMPAVPEASPLTGESGGSGLMQDLRSTAAIRAAAMAAAAAVRERVAAAAAASGTDLRRHTTQSMPFNRDLLAQLMRGGMEEEEEGQEAYHAGVLGDTASRQAGLHSSYAQDRAYYEKPRSSAKPGVLVDKTRGYVPATVSVDALQSDGMLVHSSGEWKPVVPARKPPTLAEELQEADGLEDGATTRGHDYYAGYGQVNQAVQQGQQKRKGGKGVSGKREGMAGITLGDTAVRSMPMTPDMVAMLMAMDRGESVGEEDKVLLSFQRRSHSLRRYDRIEEGDEREGRGEGEESQEVEDDSGDFLSSGDVVVRNRSLPVKTTAAKTRSTGGGKRVGTTLVQSTVGIPPRSPTSQFVRGYSVGGSAVANTVTSTSGQGGMKRGRRQPSYQQYQQQGNREYGVPGYAVTGRPALHAHSLPFNSHMVSLALAADMDEEEGEEEGEEAEFLDHSGSLSGGSSLWPAPVVMQQGQLRTIQ